MASEEDSDLEELLGRVSKKLGWQTKSENNTEMHKSTSRNSGCKKKHKSYRHSSKKEPRNPERNISSDREINVKGHNLSYKSHINDKWSELDAKPSNIPKEGMKCNRKMVLSSIENCKKTASNDNVLNKLRRDLESKIDFEHADDDDVDSSLSWTGKENLAECRETSQKECTTIEQDMPCWKEGENSHDGDFQQFEKDRDAAEKTDIQSSVSDVPFSPLHQYVDSPEPIRWLLTSPAKGRTVVTITISDSDDFSPRANVQATSLSERLAKKLKERKVTAARQDALNDGADEARRGSSDENKPRDDIWREKKTSQIHHSPSRNLPRFNNSDDEDEDEFESFLTAIKTPHQPRDYSTPSSPTQGGRYFIDDNPLSSGDENGRVYHSNVNSNRIFKTKTKERAVNKTSSLLSYRLPRFSDSDDNDDDSVFATPKALPTKLHKPTVSCSTSNMVTPTQRKIAAASSQTDFLGSLSTPRLGCTSSSPYVTDFKKQRECLTQKLFVIYNRTVFDSKLPSDFSVKWNKRLRKTAGYCYYTKTRDSGHHSRIELSDKVCDTAERLRDTLIHEMCHAACWVINGVNDGHGRFWKYWAAKANQTHPSLPIIKRCHSYEITTKYKYQCVTCSTTIGRHSKSINTDKYCCAYCKGAIVLLPSVGKDGKVAKRQTPNKFAMFVKENYGSLKKGNVSMKHADIMRLLSQDFSKKATLSL